MTAVPETSTIVWLDTPGADETHLGGEKFRNLAKLAVAEFPVPNAFVVTTTACGQFVQDAERGDAIPASIESDLRAAYDRLLDGREALVAVRSSSTAEDLEGASFAGIQESYLDVPDYPTFLKAVEDCWLSGFSERAKAYRSERADAAPAHMAVVVQLMVASRVAGVMFTQAATADEVVIEASWGLGEAVVSGTTTPDRYVVAKSTGQTSTLEIGSKHLKVVGVDEHGDSVFGPVPEYLQTIPCLANDDRQRLVEIAIAVETYYQSPQDVEWAIDADGAAYLLQARPITVENADGGAAAPAEAAPAEESHHDSLFRSLMLGDLAADTKDNDS